MITNDINTLFRKVFAKANSLKNAENTSDIDAEVRDIICHQLPTILYRFLGNVSDRYIIKGSVGVGRATKTPWIAIMDKDITNSTREGVYLVFLLSSDYKRVYLTLNQGTTVPGQFGPRLGLKDIAKNTQSIRNLLHQNNENLKQDGDEDIADERYRAGSIYYTLWNVEDKNGGQKLLTLYLGIYQKYKEITCSKKTLNANKKDVINIKFRPYITAIKSKPFLLLAGISGTGKSRIVRELARACWDESTAEFKAQKPKNFEMIQVKPNWHDSSELIGYVSRINGERYVIGPFLRFLVKAIQNPQTPHFLCLDEMNLAPVEQYFAEYLSVIESRKINTDGVVVTDPIVDFEQTEAYKSLIKQLFTDDKEQKAYLTEENGKRLSLPANMIVIGTVNMDETTFSFSRKVLDRAMTIEMNEVNLDAGLTERYEHIGKLDYKDLIGTAVEGVDVYSDNQEVCDKALNYLKAVNAILEGTPFKVAYRTRNEFLLYVVNNLPYNKDEEGNELAEKYVIARALDEVTNMKILSRIEGDDTKVTDSLLDNLKRVITEELANISDGFPVEKSVSLKKLDEMKQRLSSGYTSFWS